MEAPSAAAAQAARCRSAEYRCCLNHPVIGDFIVKMRGAHINQERNRERSRASNLPKSWFVLLNLLLLLFLLFCLISNGVAKPLALLVAGEHKNTCAPDALPPPSRLWSCRKVESIVRERERESNYACISQARSLPSSAKAGAASLSRPGGHPFIASGSCDTPSSASTVCAVNCTY